MIYTVTFNPSLDYVVDVKDFKVGVVNRTTKETIFPGGKGINVSMVLKNLGYDSTALGFTAGFVGNEIIRLLNERGVNTDFILVDKGVSRINVKLRSKEETEINGQGPEIRDHHINRLYEKLGYLDENDICTRGGIHCAILAHEALNTKEIGVVRFSMGWNNTKSDIDKVLEVIKKVGE